MSERKKCVLCNQRECVSETFRRKGLDINRFDRKEKQTIMETIAAGTLFLYRTQYGGFNFKKYYKSKKEKAEFCLYIQNEKLKEWLYFGLLRAVFVLIISVLVGLLSRADWFGFLVVSPNTSFMLAIFSGFFVSIILFALLRGTGVCWDEGDPIEWSVEFMITLGLVFFFGLPVLAIFFLYR